MKKIIVITFLLFSTFQSAQAHWGKLAATSIGFATISNFLWVGLDYHPADKIIKSTPVSSETERYIRSYLGNLIPNKPLEIRQYPEYFHYYTYASIFQSNSKDYLVLSDRLATDIETGNMHPWALKALRHEATHLRFNHYLEEVRTFNVGSVIAAGASFVAAKSAYKHIRLPQKGISGVVSLATVPAYLIHFIIYKFLADRKDEYQADEGAFSSATDKELQDLYELYFHGEKEKPSGFIKLFLSNATHPTDSERYEMACAEMKKRGLK